MSCKKHLPSLLQSSSTTADDFKTLDEFCKEVPLQEIGFDAFCQMHGRLDLIVPLYTCLEACHQGMTHIISYHRMICISRKYKHTSSFYEKNSDKVYLQRRLTEVRVHIPAKSKLGDRILVKGMGDQDMYGVCGDLFVELCSQISSVSHTL